MNCILIWLIVILILFQQMNSYERFISIKFEDEKDKERTYKHYFGANLDVNFMDGLKKCYSYPECIGVEYDTKTNDVVLIKKN